MSATKVAAFIRTSSVIVGIVTTASRSTATTMASSVIIGIVTTASRAITLTRTSSVIVGLVASFSFAKTNFKRIWPRHPMHYKGVIPKAPSGGKSTIRDRRAE